MDDEPDEDVDYGGVKVSYFTEEEAGQKRAKPEKKPAPAPEPIFDFEQPLDEPAFAPVDVPAAAPIKPAEPAKPSRAEVAAETAAVAAEIENAASTTMRCMKSLPSSAQSASVKVALSSIEGLTSKRRQLFFTFGKSM